MIEAYEKQIEDKQKEKENAAELRKYQKVQSKFQRNKGVYDVLEEKKKRQTTISKLKTDDWKASMRKLKTGTESLALKVKDHEQNFLSEDAKLATIIS